MNNYLEILKEQLNKNKKIPEFDYRNIEDETLSNNDFRRVLFTGSNIQLVLMTLQPGEEIGMEKHDEIDQFFRIESGEGKLIIKDVDEKILKDGISIIIKSGTYHNIINTSKNKKLNLYTIYCPPNHPSGTINKTKKEADEYEKNHH